MGRPRKSIEEIRLNGTYRPSRHADRAATPAVGAAALTFEPPPHLTPEQQRIWREKLATLPSGFIPREQAETFEAWCVCRDEWLKAVDIIVKTGLLVEGRDGNQVKNPAVTVQLRIQDQLRRLEVVLRLNDADSIRRHLPEQTPIWIRQPKESL